MTSCLLPQRGILELTGIDRGSFLQGLITNSVDKISTTAAIYSAFLTPQGRFFHDFFIIEHNDAWLIDCELDRAENLLNRFNLYKLRSRVNWRDASNEYKVYASWNDDTTETSGDSVCFSDPRLPDLGHRIITKAPLTTDAYFDDYDTLRLSHGIPDGSRDMPVEKAIILECGLDELNAVDWRKGCYIGQELTARTNYRGLIRKRLLPVKIEGEAPAPFTPILLEGKEVGEMRSSCKESGLALFRLDKPSLSAIIDATLNCGNATLKPTIPSWVKFQGNKDQN